jgi:hypothetical protein
MGSADAEQVQQDVIRLDNGISGFRASCPSPKDAKRKHSSGMG